METFPKIQYSPDHKDNIGNNIKSPQVGDKYYRSLLKKLIIDEKVTHQDNSKSTTYKALEDIGDENYIFYLTYNKTKTDEDSLKVDFDINAINSQKVANISHELRKELFSKLTEYGHALILKYPKIKQIIIGASNEDFEGNAVEELKTHILKKIDQLSKTDKNLIRDAALHIFGDFKINWDINSEKDIIESVLVRSEKIILKNSYLNEKEEIKEISELPRILKEIMTCIANTKYKFNIEQYYNDVSKFLGKCLPKHKQKQRLDLYERYIKSLNLKYTREEDEIIIKL